jgi:acetate kinase
VPVLVVNAGSSSLKLTLVEAGTDAAAALTVERWEGQDDTTALDAFLGGLSGIDAVGHRVVHGGDRFTAPTTLDATVIEAITGLSDLAPLHQPRSLAGIRAVSHLLPGVPAVACFDTAFHTTMPPAAHTYALPADWRRTWPIRRYGFHGLSHAYASRQAALLLGRTAHGLRLVSCHLGAGASLCAVCDGRSVDTTMGFTPLEGLVMATRSGTVDPGLVLWLIQHAGLTVDEVADGLEHSAGLAGLAGGSGDMRDVVAARDRDDPTAVLAFDVYIHRLRKEIGALVATLGGVDAVVFTGGVGEHQPTVRAAAVDGLDHLGARIDPQANAAAHNDADISAEGTSARVLVVTAREDLEIARQVRHVLGADSGRPEPDTRRGG